MHRLLEVNRQWMLRYIRRGQADKAAKSAREAAHYARVLAAMAGAEL